jgi:hypothetical protein
VIYKIKSSNIRSAFVQLNSVSVNVHWLT